MAIKHTTTELAKYRPFVIFSSKISRKGLQRLRSLFLILFLFSVLGVTTGFVIYLPINPLVIYAGALFNFGMWLSCTQLYFYSNSFYFSGINSNISSEGKDATALTYPAATILLRDEHDSTKAFLYSSQGAEIMRRSEISTEILNTFLESDRPRLNATAFPLASKRPTTVFDIASYIYMYDAGFKSFCIHEHVSEEVFLATAAMVSARDIAAIRSERWWSRDSLSWYGTLGRSLTEGIPFELYRYSSPLPTPDVTGMVTPQQDTAVATIMNVLARSKAANVLLIGNPGVGILDIITLAEHATDHKIGYHALHRLHFVLLDTERVFGDCPDAITLETTLHHILAGAARAGKYAVVINNLSHFIETADKRGVAIVSLLEEYLMLPTLHIIATDNPQAYHASLKNNLALIRRFEEILIEPEDSTQTISLLEPVALGAEINYGIEFSYPALIAIATGAERYLTTGDMPERALLLLTEVAESAVQTNSKFITKDFVSSLLAQKTGIPIGPITAPERGTLLQLEEILHTRIIGQEAAISALARTMRRARVDIERADKPIGSFLFLGPTGVGKTETAKALAYVFFGNETALVRFDMSEFSNHDSLGRLIGQADEPGRLTTALTEHPYAVVLLDEFEKSAPQVHDLFLQILDEGFFTNHHGTRINTRNTIIIATSNAGSSLIQSTKMSRKNNPVLDAEIIQHIITTGVFKSELINRFDSTIIFESLDQTEQAHVAHLLLQELTARIASQGFTLELEPDLFNALVTRGYDAAFGARAMGRTIQDTIEDAVASRIIAGSVTTGDTIHLGLTDVFPN